MLPPGPDRSPRVWELAALRRDPLRYFAELRRHGEVAHVAVRAAGVLLVRITLVQDPALIKKILVDDDACFEKPRALKKLKVLLGEGLLTSEGEHHRRQRRLMQPAFHRDAVLRYAPTMVECAAQAEARWQDGATLDMMAELMHVTLAIAGRTLFGVDVTAEADEIGRALATLMEAFPDFISPFAALWRVLPTRRNRAVAAALARIDETIFRIIAARRASGEVGDDLLGRLLAAEDEGKAGMTEQQVRDEAITLFLAGHETTAVALAWTFYLLAGHPEALAAVHVELDAVLAGRLPTADDLPRLVHTRRALQEAMRLREGVGSRHPNRPQSPATTRRRSTTIRGPAIVPRCKLPGPGSIHPSRAEKCRRVEEILTRDMGCHASSRTCHSGAHGRGLQRQRGARAGQPRGV